MLTYIIRRLVLLVPLLIAISFVIFLIIQMPAGDYVSTYVEELRASGVEVTPDQIENLKRRYGLEKPIYAQYATWMKNMILDGDFGRSFRWNKPVREILLERVPLTIVVSLASTAFVFLLAIPIGIYSATHKYSALDYLATFIGFIGLSVPGFLLALILVWVIYITFGVNMSGLFSREYADAPWSIGKVLDMLKRIWFPMIIIGMSGTAGLIRVMRANLLDELQKQYVITARAKGLPERELLFRYPVRMAHKPDRQHDRLDSSRHRRR
jgi:peptide/nickel transport system permease protein